MTILWIYDMPLIPEAGGTERITSLVAQGLTERGYNCLGILVFNHADGSIRYADKQISNLYNFLNKNKVDVVINQIAYSKWLLEKFLSSGGKQWHEEGGKIISCLHFDPKNPSTLHLLVSGGKLKASQFPLYLKLLLLKGYYTRQQRRCEGDVYNYIYDNSDTFVTLSQTHFPYLRKVMKRDEYGKLHAINNPLTFPNISSAEILVNKKKTVIVCARMSEYHKRISLILRAWKLVKGHAVAKEWDLKLLGQGPDLNRYKETVAKEGIADVHFLGQQSPEKFYEEASILLLSSSAEGWGLAITEGLQRGVVPVVMNSSPVYSEIITNSYNGILTPDSDVKSFANSIVALMSDPRRLKSMQQNALESAKKFTIKETINKWITIL